MASLAQCLSCGSTNLKPFYELVGVPVQSVQLIYDRVRALQFPKGDILLTFCQECGFIFNRLFDPALENYAIQYESTQAYSSTFNAFASRLANQLIGAYHLQNKKIVEIGCGQGEFLSLMCELGENEGVGIDPAYVEGRLKTPVPERLTFFPDYYSEKYTNIQADFVCCKMTLEHIQNTRQFLFTIRNTLEGQPDAVVFFQIPNVRHILTNIAFWDVYYEHCSYFSQGSLARLFRRAGFDVIDLWTDYADQYLMITAMPGDGYRTPFLSQEDDLAKAAAEVDQFAEAAPQKVQEWRSRIRSLREQARKIVLWGSGSKGVAFLTTLGLFDEIEYTVDINPLKEGTYMAGTGQKVVCPDFLKMYRPDYVAVMNPIYEVEVRHQLNELGLSPELIAVA
ncbi:MAG TPA: class I SAM-dependent methyltransferase [Anaerolineaceae bacterium]|nr:class I SAM-dependent methyltransferase [Anaerolineaceae bacterium]